MDRTAKPDLHERQEERTESTSAERADRNTTARAQLSALSGDAENPMICRSVD
jgi:hypothetical protein